MQTLSSAIVPSTPCSVAAHPPAINHNHAAALAFAHAGFPVFPCEPFTKRPLVPRGFKDATTGERTIARWARQWSDALYGSPTAAIWVLDIDASPTLADSMARMLDALGMDKQALAASCGLVVATPGGGRHLYFRRTNGIAIRTGAGDIATGVDTRGHDVHGAATGYIIAPGCVLPDGRSYRVMTGSHGALLTDELPEAPRALLYLAMFSKRERAIIAADAELQDAIRRHTPIAWRADYQSDQAMHRPAPARLDTLGVDRMRKYAAAALHAEAETLAGLTDGRRDAVFRSACRLAKFSVHGVLTAEEIREALLAAWDAAGGTAKYGRQFANGAITRGLAMGKNDLLPVFDAGRNHHHSGREV